jgi:hypothetical protein
MKQIPIKEFDEEINVIIIRKPKNTLTLGAVFQSLKKLEILRIVESNVAAIGMHSFWGVPSLRILGEPPRAGRFHFIISTLPGRLIAEQHHRDIRRQL